MSQRLPIVARGGYGFASILIALFMVMTSVPAHAQSAYSAWALPPVNQPQVVPTQAALQNDAPTSSMDTTARDTNPKADRVVGGNAVANWGFETGDFTSWVPKDMSNPFWPMIVGGAGNSAFGFISAPTEGLFSVQHGFDGGGPDTIEVAQDLTIPSGVTAQVLFDYRGAWDMFNIPGSTQNRVFSVQVQPTGGGAPLQTTTILTAAAGTVNPDTGVLGGAVSLDAFVGQAVRIVFHWDIPESFTGPGFFELDNVRLTGDGLGAAYVRSTVGSPWGSTSNEAAMDAAFGAGGWADMRYETLSLGDLFEPTRQFVFLEGSDHNADELEAFLGANQAAIADWVAAGHCLFINSAPNEGNGMAFGFGVTLTYMDLGGEGNAVDPFHRIFNGPFTPVTTAFTGGSFAHATLSGGGIAPVIENENLDTVYGEKEHGEGFVGFGGMTTDNFHSPQPEAANLRANILDHIAGQCFDAQRAYVAATWSDQSINFLNADLDQTGRFTAGSTDPNGVATDGVIVYSGHWTTQEVIGYDFGGSERFRWSGTLSNLQGMELVGGELGVARAGNVDFFEPTTGAFIRSISAQSSVEGIAFDGTLLWQLGDSIFGTDPADGSVVTTIPNAASGCTYGGTGITVSGRDRLTLTCTNGDWFVVRSDTGAAVDTGNNGLDMYGAKKVPRHPALQSIYLTSIDFGNSAFAVYDIASDSWKTLNPYDTQSQIAVDAAGDLYAYGVASGQIDTYDKITDSWTPFMPAPPGTTPIWGNLEITTAGEFLYTAYGDGNLYYTTAGVWNSTPLGFDASANGDYDPLTNQYVIGQHFSENVHMIDVNTLSITSFTGGSVNEVRRFGAVLNGRYYVHDFTGPIRSYDLYNNAAGPVDETGPFGFYNSSAPDRANGLIYVGDLDGSGLQVFDPDNGVLKPLTPYVNIGNHSSLAPGFGGPFFADGFESGDTSAWSNTVP